MILDIAELEDGAELSTDLCIVGSGPAGIAIARTLAPSGLDRILLESGGMAHEPDTHALQAGTCLRPALHPPADRFRARRLGGSSTLWGGRCVPFDPIDFETRAWIPHSGWPIGADTLAPYLPEAASLLELGTPEFSAARALPGGMRPMLAGFADPDVSTDSIERFSRPTDLGRAQGAALAADPSLRLILHATCTSLRLAPGATRIDRLTVRSLRGRRLTIRPRAVILATGGLETPRLLLASMEDHPAGLGNGHGLVGRNYLSHLAATLGRFTPALGHTPFHGYERDADGIYCRRRLALTPALQRRAGCGNAIARLHHPRIADPSHRTGPLSLLWFLRPLLRYEYATRLADAPPPGAAAGHLLNLLADAPATARFAHMLLTRRLLARRKLPSIAVPPRTGSFSLDLHAEQVPNLDSRVMLGRERDALGLPRLVIDWRTTALDRHTAASALAAIGTALERGGHGRLVHAQDTLDADLLRDGAYGGHHLGTARMAASPRQGVVDADLRVHGLANLYLAGSAVFPTSSQANPTLTLVMLALRLADHLRRDLTRHPAAARLDPAPAFLH